MATALVRYMAMRVRTRISGKAVDVEGPREDGAVEDEHEEMPLRNCSGPDRRREGRRGGGAKELREDDV
jgi:hypothetical protein